MTTISLRRSLAALGAATLVAAGTYLAPAVAEGPNTSINLTKDPGTDTVEGQQVTFTARVTRNDGSAIKPTGPVTFVDDVDSENPVTLGTKSLDAKGRAIFKTTALSLGNHHVYASYAGDGVADPVVSDGIYHYVNYPDSKTTISPRTGTISYGTPITATVTIQKPGSAPPPYGYMDWFDGNTFLVTTDVVKGKTSLPGTYLTVGEHDVSAQFVGTANGSSDVVTLSVVKGSTNTSLTSSVNPSGPGQKVTFTARTTKSPSGQLGGTITIKIDDSTVLVKAPDAGGKVTYSTKTLSNGDHTVTASYSGDANYEGSGTTFIQSVNPPAA